MTTGMTTGATTGIPCIPDFTCLEVIPCKEEDFMNIYAITTVEKAADAWFHDHIDICKIYDSETKAREYLEEKTSNDLKLFTIPPENVHLKNPPLTKHSDLYITLDWSKEYKVNQMHVFDVFDSAYLDKKKYDANDVYEKYKQGHRICHVYPKNIFISK